MHTICASQEHTFKVFTLVTALEKGVRPTFTLEAPAEYTSVKFLDEDKQPWEVTNAGDTPRGGTYDLTQTDIDTRSDFRNVAAAQSAPQNVFDLSTWDIPIAGDTSVTLTKTSTNLTDADGDGVADTPVDAPTTVDYQLVAVYSDRLEFTREVSEKLPEEFQGLFPHLPDDSTRLFDLTHVITDSGKSAALQRLDRLAVGRPLRGSAPRFPGPLLLVR